MASGYAVYSDPEAPVAENSLATAIQQGLRDFGGRVKDLVPVYASTKPYPFIVIDDFLPPAIADEVLAEFPSPRSEIWHRCRTADQHNKLALSHESMMPSAIRTLIHELNSGFFLEILEELTGIGNLVADTKLVGGGLHQIERGGKLNVHVDYSHHPGNRLNRRLNLILYLNRDWRDEYGGHFEIWDRHVKQCEHRIAPLFNRCVIFSTTRFSYHGHPDPLTCPEGMSRKSIALYYYSHGRPEEPGPIVEHNTLFRLRPGERFSWNNFLVRMASSGWLRDLMPPVLYRWLRGAWNRRLRQPKA
jgi:hypothetical protein